MPGIEKTSSGGVYLSIVGGTLVQKVEEGTAGAKLRKWETPDGKKGEKWELSYRSWAGLVQKISFEDTEYGVMLKLALDDATLTVNTESRYFSDIATKLCAADLTKVISFAPYDFEVEEGKRKTGVTVTVDGVKLSNPFYNFETKKTLGGHPEPAKKMDKDSWKIFFINVKKFLMGKLEELVIPESNKAKVATVVEEEQVTITDLPWETNA